MSTTGPSDAAVEAAGHALCRWRMVAAVDAEFNTGTAMAEAALGAAYKVDEPRIRAEARAELLAEVVEWLQERLEGHDSNCITVNIGGFKRRFGDQEREETPDV